MSTEKPKLHSRPNARRTKQSAGILLYRRNRDGLEVLLAHPGGPFWRRRDDGAWTIPKGEIEFGENELTAARREFAEETGYRPAGDALSLGYVRQPGGKIVHVWAIEADWDPAQLTSNTFSLEWPPRSKRVQCFPEIDRADWFPLDTATQKISKGLAPFLSRLQAELASRTD